MKKWICVCFLWVILSNGAINIDKDVNSVIAKQGKNVYYIIITGKWDNWTGYQEKVLQYDNKAERDVDLKRITDKLSELK